MKAALIGAVEVYLDFPLLIIGAEIGHTDHNLIPLVRAVGTYLLDLRLVNWDVFSEPL